MKKSRLLVLALAVAAAGGAFMLANTPKPAPVEVAAPAAPAPLPSDEVMTASHDLPVGTILAEGDLTWLAWPKSGVASTMITRAAEPKAVDDIKGSIVRGSFVTGEPIYREKLIKGAGSGFMSAILPTGMRAVAINIDSQGSTSAGGFILPNDRVDVVHTFNDQSKPGVPGGQGAVTSETLLRNVRVLAIGQNVQEKNGQSVVVGSNATLELDPVQAEAVILAQRLGQLSLTLRSVLDTNKDSAALVKEDKTLTIVRYGNATEGDVR